MSSTEEISFTISAIDQASETVAAVDTNIQSMETDAQSAGVSMQATTQASDEAANSFSGTGSAALGAAASLGSLAIQATAVERAQKNVEQANLSVQKASEGVTAAQDALNKVMQSGGVNADALATAQQVLVIAHEKVELAQTKLNDAVTKYGPNSTQATSATIALQTAQLSLASAQDKVNAAMQPAGPTADAIAKAQQNLKDAEDKLSIAHQNAEIRTESLNERFLMLGTTGIPMALTAFSNISTVATSLPGALGALSGVFDTTAVSIGGMDIALGPLLIVIIAVVAAVAILYEAWTNDWGGIREKAAAAWDFLKSGIDAFVKDVLGIWNGLEALYSTVVDLWNKIVGFIQGAVQAIENTVQGLWNALVGHSIWTDMLTTMHDQTKTTMDAIVGTFQSGFAKIPGAVPSLTLGGSATGLSLGGTPSSGLGGSPIALTNQVYLDSKLLTTITQKQFMEQSRMRAQT